MAHQVDTADAANRLADHLLDPNRERPVVCVSIPAWASVPLLDVDALERELDGSAELWVVPTGDATWELSYRLPTGMDVYGGAVRLWWPGVDEEADRYAHPLFFVHAQSDTPAVVERILSALERGGALARKGPEPGSEHAAVVTGVLYTGAELELTDGTPVFAHRSHLSRHDLPPEQVVRVGQAVRVRVSQSGQGGAGRRRAPVSLLPFEPDPWERLREAYPEGTLLEAVVTELRNIGAFAELLPGLVGLIHKSKISYEWVSHPEDFLRAGERVRVRIEQVEEAGHRISLSMLDIPANARATVATIYPDGPPWLAADTTPALAVPLAAEPGATELADVDNTLDLRRELAMPAKLRPAPTDLDHPGGSAAPPETDLAPAAAAFPERSVKPSPEPEPEPVGRIATEAPDLRTAAPEAELDELDELERTVAEARDAQREVRTLLDDGERRLARLRGEAAQIRRTLERDLGDVRRRILEVVESESNLLIGSTQAALEAARTEAVQLREQLAAADEDRQRILERLREESSRATHAERTARESQDRLRREREATQALRTELRRLVPDAAAHLRDEIYTAWENATTPADRNRYPWRSPVIGPEFAESLERVHGVSRERVIEVCAEVVCGRARERAGLEVHPLRTSEAGGSAQRVRADGAKAYRASLQVNSPSARRLHYWELPDHGIELAKIVYHDDFSIR